MYTKEVVRVARRPSAWSAIKPESHSIFRLSKGDFSSEHALLARGAQHTRRSISLSSWCAHMQPSAQGCPDTTR